MPATLNEQVVDDITNTNFKVIGGHGAIVQNTALDHFVHASNMALHSANSHQRRVELLSELHLAAAIERGVTLDPRDALGALKAMTGDDIAQKLLSGIIALSGSQISEKTAITSPPVTNPV